MADDGKMNEDAMEAMERNLTITRTRIMAILYRSLSKLAVIICIDELLKDNGELIAHLFTRDELRDILKIYNRYKSSAYSRSYSMRDPYTQSFHHDIRTDVRVIQVIRTLYNNDKVRAFAKCYTRNVTGSGKDFYDVFKDFIRVIEEKIYTSSVERRNYEKNLGKTWKDNRFHLSQIKRSEKSLEEMDNDLQEKIKRGFQLIRNFEREMIITDNNNDRDRVTLTCKAERKMAQKFMMSAERTANLEEEANRVTTQYNKIVADHMKKEKVMRIKRYKVETILVSWLTKYDQDMYELQKEYEYIEENFEVEKELMDELQERYDIQEETYIVLMEEKAIEEQRIFDEKFLILMRFHSARRIQTWWRYILYRRSRRRKKKGRGKGKGKGKKK